MSNRREKFLTGGKGWRGGGAYTVLLKFSRVTCLGLIPGHGLLCASWPCVPGFLGSYLGCYQWEAFLFQHPLEELLQGDAVVAGF